MKKIFESFALGNLRLKNRLVRSATWEAGADADGSLTDEIYDIYDELANGGIGLIITGFTSVSRDDRYLDGMMRLSDDFLIPQYKKLTDMIHHHSTPIITQLALGAFYRKAGNGFERVEADDMTADEIHLVICQFIDAAVRAGKAGFDGVQIHAAHFFFLSRFISPVVNHRTDEYGGSTENRIRILLEILQGIKKEAPGLHVTIKLNASDFIPGGIDEEESLKIARMLDKAGIDSIEVSGNGPSVAGVRAHRDEGFFTPLAARMAEEVSVPVMVVGGFRAFDTMQNVLNQTKIELISLSRPLLREPDLPVKMKADATVISQCISCNSCYSSPFHKCIFR